MYWVEVSIKGNERPGCSTMFKVSNCACKGNQFKLFVVAPVSIPHVQAYPAQSPREGAAMGRKGAGQG